MVSGLDRRAGFHSKKKKKSENCVRQLTAGILRNIPMDSHRNYSIYSSAQDRMALKQTSFLPNFHAKIIRLSTFQFSTSVWVGIFNPFRFFHLKPWVVDNRRRMVAYVSGDACRFFGLVGCGPVGELMNFCCCLHSGTLEITIHHAFFYDMTATMSGENKQILLVL